MILVILGTQNHSFKRLLESVDYVADALKIEEKIMVQSGHTDYKSAKMEIVDFMPKETMESLIKESDLIIAHAGVGTILDCIKNKKKVIVVPRLKEFGEHINNHQLQIAQEFQQRKLILLAKNREELLKCIKKVAAFSPHLFKTNNKHFISKLEEGITNLIKR